MIEELKLFIGDKEIEGDLSEFQIEISVEGGAMDRPFNARRFLIEHTDLAREDIEKIDMNERWIFSWNKCEYTKGETCIEIFFDIASPLSVNEIDERIIEIKKTSLNPAITHIKEQRLWHDVLSTISEGVVNPQELAKKCLETENIKFYR